MYNYSVLAALCPADASRPSSDHARECCDCVSTSGRLSILPTTSSSGSCRCSSTSVSGPSLIHSDFVDCHFSSPLRSCFACSAMLLRTLMAGGSLFGRWIPLEYASWSSCAALYTSLSHLYIVSNHDCKVPFVIDILGEVFWLFRPYEWPLEFNHHLFYRSRSIPFPYRLPMRSWLVYRLLLLLYERSYTLYSDAVCIVEIISKVELVEF